MDFFLNLTSLVIFHKRKSMNYVGFYVLEVTFPDPVLADFLTLLFFFFLLCGFSRYSILPLLLTLSFFLRGKKLTLFTLSLADCGKMQKLRNNYHRFFCVKTTFFLHYFSQTRLCFFFPYKDNYLNLHFTYYNFAFSFSFSCK